MAQANCASICIRALSQNCTVSKRILECLSFDISGYTQEVYTLNAIYWRLRERPCLSASQGIRVVSVLISADGKLVHWSKVTRTVVGGGESKWHAGHSFTLQDLQLKGRGSR